MFVFKQASPDNSDFIRLVNDLRVVLISITRDSGDSSFKADEYNCEKDAYGLVYRDSKAVACGGFRSHVTQACELKRMYSMHPGAGSYLLTQLEQLALSKGYREAVLSTRRINTNAIEFYHRHAYTEIKPYGKYAHQHKSICMGKTLISYNLNTDKNLL